MSRKTAAWRRASEAIRSSQAETAPPPQPASAPSHQSESALRKLPLLLLNQVLTRAFTFLLNVFVVRASGAAIFGIASVNLHLLYTTILFLSREALRMYVVPNLSTL